MTKCQTSHFSNGLQRKQRRTNIKSFTNSITNMNQVTQRKSTKSQKSVLSGIESLTN